MKRHLIIAGTGRAGTTFLVQYLAACGLETRLSSSPGEALDEAANAGLEDLPVEGSVLPYVIKSPWLFEFVKQLVERRDIAIDAVIVPMRDIVEAATSRILLEMRARYGQAELDETVTNWEHWAATPGGVIYSLNPLDQARILAMGFHEVIRVLVRKNIPIVFLDFPRLIEDGEYLWQSLQPVISSKVEREAAMAAHASLADASKVRTGREIRREGAASIASSSASTATEMPIGYPAHTELDRLSLLRELDRLRKAVTERKTFALRDGEQSQHAQDEIEQLRAQLSDAQRLCEHLRDNLRLQNEHLQQVTSSRDEILSSRSWKWTSPLRALSLVFTPLRGRTK